MIDADYLKGRVKEIRESIKELNKFVSKPFDMLTLYEKYAIRYQIIILAEALGSLCLHVAIEEFGYEANSYAECFKYIEEKGLLNIKELIKIVRLRNLLVHRYWIIDDLKIYEAIKEDFESVEELLKNIEERYGIR